MKYGELDLVYFAYVSLGLFRVVKVGWTTRLPRRVISLRRTVRILFGTSEIEFYVIPHGTVWLEVEIQERLREHRAFGKTPPATDWPYQRCGFTEWFHVDETVENCLNEYKAQPLTSHFFYEPHP